MRTFRRSPTLFVLLVVTFGLFLAYTFGLSGPDSDPITSARDVTVTVVSDVPSRPDAPMLPLLAVGGPMLVLAIVCGLFTFVSAAVTVALATGRCGGGQDRRALLN